MKICFISLKSYQLFNPAITSVFGGAEVQMSMFAKTFAQQKHLDISVMVADYGQAKKEFRDGVHLYTSLSFDRHFLANIRSFFRTFVHINADVYIKRALTLSSALMAFFCKIMGKKFVYMVAHDDEVNGKKDVFKYPLAKILVNYLFRNSILIVQNSYQYQQLISQGLSPIMLKSGYDIPRSITLPREKKSILWVSRSKAWKRPEMFLSLAKAFPKEQFVMICPKATDEHDYFLQIKHQASIIKNLTFIDFVPFEEIDPYFLSAKVFVNTSVSEGFPNTYIQALKNKTPLLSLCVDPDDIITTTQCGIVCNNDYDVMVQGLDTMLTDNTRYHAMQEHGFDYVQKYHSIQNNANKLLSIISSH